MVSLEFDAARSQNDNNYKNLFNSFNNYITLSYSFERIDSLLYNIFFKPTVPCNLVGAHLIGIIKAIEPFKSDLCIFVLLIAKKCPKLSPLWLATIWNGQVSRVLKSAIRGLLPISLLAALWIGTIQSFL